MYVTFGVFTLIFYKFREEIYFYLKIEHTN